MTNAEKAQQINKAVGLLTGSASAYRHGRGSTGRDKFDKALDLLDLIEHGAASVSAQPAVVRQAGDGMNKETLEGLWEQATSLPDAQDSPLTVAVIAEALSEDPTCDPQEAAQRVYQIANDCEAFANAITERAQGLTTG